MRKPQGYAIIMDPASPVATEYDSITCKHCNTIVLVITKEDMEQKCGFCIKCFSHICAKCADNGNCVPFEKALDKFEKAVALNEQKSAANKELFKAAGLR